MSCGSPGNILSRRRQESFGPHPRLQPGDRVLIGDQDAVADGAVESVKRIPAKEPAYNLLVSPGGTYLANGIVVHNKGCFLPETLIRKEDGTEVPISSVRPKDRLLAFTIEGEAVIARVRTVVTHEVDRYKVVKTRNLAVQVTAEHPFYVGNGTFKTLESLKVGDPSSPLTDGDSVAQPIESIAVVQKKVLVYNLQTDAPNTFLANGFLVHNKGGGGGGGIRRWWFHGGDSTADGGSSGESGWLGFLVIFLAFVIVVDRHHKLVERKRGSGRESRLRLQPRAGCQEERQDAQTP